MDLPRKKIWKLFRGHKPVIVVFIPFFFSFISINQLHRVILSHHSSFTHFKHTVKIQHIRNCLNFILNPPTQKKKENYNLPRDKLIGHFILVCTRDNQLELRSRLVQNGSQLGIEYLLFCSHMANGHMTISFSFWCNVADKSNSNIIWW